MKTILLFFFVTITVFGQEVRTPLKTTHVTVYQGQAQLFANARVNLPMGTTEVVLENVAATAEPNSFQVSAKGEAVLLGVKFRPNYLQNKGKSPQVKAIEDSLKLVRESIGNRDILVAALVQERTVLLANASVGTQQVPPTPQKITEMADFFRKRSIEIGTLQRKAETELVAFRETEARLVQQLNAPMNMGVGEAVLTVSTKKNTAIDLEVSYLANNAGWSPSYDVRVKDTKSPVSVGYRASVWQNTQLNWNNVRLTLSSGNPNEGGQKPELSTQFVNIYQPPVYRSMAKTAAAPQAEKEMAVTMDEASAETDVPVMSTMAFLPPEEKTLATLFEITVPYTIPSDGQTQNIDIQQFELPASYQFSTVPKLDSDAFLVANLTAWERYNFLPGTANVYFEGAYVGESFLNPQLTRDSLALSLGRDKRIVVQREKLRDFTTKKFLKSNIEESVGFKTTLRNTKKEEVTVLVEDQLPVSQNASIEITPNDLGGAEHNPETGKLLWRITLKPNEIQTIRFGYTATYPKDRRVVGLD